MYMTSRINDRNRWDQAGIGASLLCVLHCLLTPVLITVIPVLAATEHQTHSAFAILIFLFGMLAFIPGYRRHRKRSIPVIGAVSVGMIILAALFPEVENAELIENALVVVGGAALISAHFRNVYWCRFCRTCSATGCQNAATQTQPAAS